MNPAAQYAMEQRDQRYTATQNERPTIANVQILLRPCTNTWIQYNAKALQQMNLELASGPLPKPAESRLRYRKRVALAAQNKASSLDICVILSNAFGHSLHRARYNPKATYGLTDECSFSIFQLDQAL